VLERTQSGLEVAEADLAHRGPGDILAGVKQSGASSLSVMTLHEVTRQPQLMEDARAAAVRVAEQGGLAAQMRAALVAYGFWDQDGRSGS
jgi:RecG-like helicase